MVKEAEMLLVSVGLVKKNKIVGHFLAPHNNRYFGGGDMTYWSPGAAEYAGTVLFPSSASLLRPSSLNWIY